VIIMDFWQSVIMAVILIWIVLLVFGLLKVYYEGRL